MKHASAVRRAVRAANLSANPANLPLVELCVTLARQVDDSGPEGPGTRLSAAYLSALKDLTRACEHAPGRAGPVVSELDAWRTQHTPRAAS